jgi:hypothetical protein
MRNSTVVGTPIPGFPGVDAVTSENDWVVTGSNYGNPFRLYVSPHVTRESAIEAVALALTLKPDGLDWISAKRRHEVERCVRLDSNWLASRVI